MRVVLAASLVVCAAAARAQTTPAMTADDLRNRLVAFAHDSMQGRATGTTGHYRATEYIAQELTRLRLQPMGERGGYFQELGAVAAQVTNARLGIEATQFRLGVEFVPIAGVSEMPFGRVAVATRRPFEYMGTLGKSGGGDNGFSIGLGQAKEMGGDIKGKVVIVDPPLRADGLPDYQVWTDPGLFIGYQDAGAVLIAALDFTPRSVIQRFMEPWIGWRDPPQSDWRTPPVFLVTRATATMIRSVKSGAATAVFSTTQRPLMAPARNVVAMIEGSDPRLKSEFVVLTAHTDHLGIADTAARDGADSVYNGVNAGSGAMALLEIAEHIASLPQKPARSILFVWTAAAEQGLLGSKWLLDHSPIDRDDIAAAISVDLIARGPDSGLRAPREFDGAAAVPCSGDEWNFTRRGIPAVGLSTGAHEADRSVGDDARQVDYAVFLRATELVSAFALDVASRPRPRGARVDVKVGCM